MRRIAADSIRAVHHKIDPSKKVFTFEIMGLDFMIDDDFRTWFIEANTNPCLETSCPLLQRIIPPMIENAFKIAIDPLFPPPNWPTSKRHSMPDAIYENNRWELIYDELLDGVELKPHVEAFSKQTQASKWGE